MARRVDDLKRRVDQLERRVAASPDLARLEEAGMTPEDLRVYRETGEPPDGLSREQAVILERVHWDAFSNVVLGAKLPPA